MRTRSPTETELVAALQELAAADKWAFRSWSAREYAHGLFQYPAMMVPQMQRELLAELCKANDASSLYDPFVGSGTTLAEAMLQGLNFLGTDVNPLAILLCRAKAGPFFMKALAAAGDRVCAAAQDDRGRKIELDWDGWEKWFRVDVAIALSKLRRAIRREPTKQARRFLWVCLAETVRLTSNSRTSTVKLHIRPATEIATRTIDPLGLFEKIFSRNLDRFGEQSKELRDAGLLTPSGYYRRETDLHLHDIRSGAAPGDIPCELLLTSPPYGDNVTTVPYGQAAYLPLRWIDLHDIDNDCDERFLATTHAIDAMSLGASRKDALGAVEPLRAASPTLDTTLTALENRPRDRAARVAAFWRDLATSLDHIIASLAPGALMAWTVGNRRVGDRQIPMDAILTELLAKRSCIIVTTVVRQIPDCRKRMASRNSIAATMNAEKVLVLRTATAD